MNVKPDQLEVFRPIDVLNTFTELRHSKVKYKFVFYKVPSPPTPLSLLKLPNLRRHGHNGFSLEETTTHIIGAKVLDISATQDKSATLHSEAVGDWWLVGLTQDRAVWVQARAGV